MLLRAQAFALFVMMALTTSLQGTAVLQCLCSGRVILAGFGKTECHAKKEDAKPHCPKCARKVAPAPDSALCAAGCWRVIDFGAGEPKLAAAVPEMPSPSPADLPETVSELVPPRDFAQREPVAHRPPDPPGPALTILYASFLI